MCYKSTQQPAERHVMHESERWKLFPYDCMDKEEVANFGRESDEWVERLMNSCGDDRCEVHRGVAMLA